MVGAAKINKTRLLTAIVYALLIVAISLITPINATAAPDPTDVPAFELAWGSGNDAFMLPYDVAIGSGDTTYVVDQNAHNVQKFSRDGSFISEWGSLGSGNGQLNNPRGVAVDSSGNVYVADSSNNRIQKFDSNGTYLTKWGANGSGNGQLASPRDIVLDGDDNVYVVDYFNDRIQKFDSSGAYLAKWGGFGTDNGEFDGPLGVAVDDGNIYVADGGNDRIQKFDSNGTYLTKWGTSGSGNGQLNQPWGIAVDATGDVYVSDVGNYRIQKFTNNGVYLAQWGTGGAGDGEFFYHYNIAIDDDGSVYVDDAGNHRVQKFSYAPESAILTSASSGADIRLESANAFTTFTCNTSVAEASLTTQDSENDYPLDFIDFCLDVPDGSTNTITITFETDLTADEVTARKYLPTSQTYVDVPGAQITATTLDGNPALSLTYDVTDGGTLDDDGIVNGTILDPVGLATVTPSTSLPNSDMNTNADSAALADTGSELISLYMSIAVLFGLTMFMLIMYRRRVM